MLPLIAKARLLRRYTNPINLGRKAPEWASKLAETLVFTLEKRRGGNAWLHIPSLHQPSLLAMTQELTADGASDRAALDFTALLLARGNSRSRWGGSWFNPTDPEVMHLLVCGVDWNRYQDPGTEKWTSFIGTDEQEQEDVLGVHLYCRCNSQAEDGTQRWLLAVELGFEIPSVVDLIRVLSVDQMERLFG